MKPAIVVLAYHRPDALKRLLASLDAAVFDVQVPLIISVDLGSNMDQYMEVVALADDFKWKHGAKQLIIQKEHLGTRGHVLFAGDLTEKYGSVIVLEDDLGVSPWFYHYATAGLNFYQSDTDIAGISLYGYQVSERNFQPLIVPASTHDIYLMQFPSSWGQVWTAEQWGGFKEWLSDGNRPYTDVPQFVKDWSGTSWKRDFLSYLLATDKFFVYPKVSLSTNYGDKGVNFSLDLQLYQVPLETEKREYHFGGKAEGASVLNAWFSADEAAKTDTGRYLIEDAEYRLQQSKGSAEAYWLFKLRYLFFNYLNVLVKKLFGR